MQNQYNATVLDWRTSFTQNLTVPFNKRPAIFWKGLLISLMLLFSLVAVPWYGSTEINLSSENIRQLVNEDRKKSGLSPLQASLKLEQAAEAKAEDILKKGYFAHTSPQGLEPWDFIKSTGLDYAFAGENLALNYTNSYELIRDLLTSPSHRDNLLSPLFSEIGIAVIRGEYQGKKAVVTVQMFASPH